MTFSLLPWVPGSARLAWAYELTPEGIKRTEEINPPTIHFRSTGRKLDLPSSVSWSP